MGNNCKKNTQNYKVQDLEGEFDVSLIHKGILRNVSGLLSEQKVNELILVYQGKLIRRPSNFLLNLNIGICLYSQGFYETSQLHLQTCSLAAGNYKMFYVLGLISMNKGSLDEAFEYFNLCVGINPLFPSVYVKLAEIYLKRDDLKAVKFMFTKDFDFKVYPELYLLKGIYYKKRQKLAKAKKSLKQAIDVQYELSKSYYYLGDIYFSLQNSEKSMKAYQNSIIYTKGKFLGFVKVSQAVLYFDKERFDLMLKILKESLNYGPQIKSFIKSKGFDSSITSQDFILSVEKYMRGEFVQVISTLKPIFRKNRENLLFGMVLALAYLKTGQYDKSVHYFKKLLKHSKKAFNEIGEIIRKKSKNQIKQCREYMESFPTEEVKMEYEETFEFEDSPSLKKLQIPEFFISFNNFLDHRKKRENKSASFLIGKEASISRLRSSTPNKSGIQTLINTTVE